MNLLIAALSLGFLGSFHCIGMCGPIAMALPVHQLAGWRKWPAISLYNLGRAFTYAGFGLLFGAIGQGFALFGYQRALSVTLGVILLLSVLLPGTWFRRYKIGAGAYAVMNRLKAQMGRLLGQAEGSSLFLIGVLNGFLPCGLVYVALSGAIATGNTWQGAAFMALFGLGTLPLMFSISAFSQWIGPGFRARLRRVVPVFIGLMAITMILRGMNLGIPYLSPRLEADGNMSCHSTEKACCQHKKN